MLCWQPLMLNFHNRTDELFSACSWEMKRSPAGGRVKHMCVREKCSHSTRRKSMRVEYNDSDRNPTLCTTWGHLLWFNTQPLHSGSVNGSRFREKHQPQSTKSSAKPEHLRHCRFCRKSQRFINPDFFIKRLWIINESQMTLEQIRTARRFRQLLNDDILKTLWNQNCKSCSF